MADIVIIDDDPVLAGLTQKRLAPIGVSAVVHAGAMGATNFVRSEKPKVVILDLNMPALNGDKLVEILRDTPGLGTLRFLLMSNIDSQQLEEIARESRFDAWLPKTCTTAELLATVTRLLGERSA